MKATLFCALLGVAVLSPLPALAQTDIKLGCNPVDWDANCSQSKSFKNKTGRLICDFNIYKTVGPDNRFVRDCIVEDGIGNWLVDDNHNGNVTEAGEADKEDQTPGAPAPDYQTRVQYSNRPGVPAGQCIPKEGTFGITLCGDDITTGPDDNLDMSGYKFCLHPTSESGGEMMALGPCDGGSNDVVLVNAEAFNPNHFYTVQAENNTGGALHQVQLRSPDVGVQVVAANSTPPSSFDPFSGVMVFNSPVAPNDTLTIDYVLNQLSGGSTTTLEIGPCIRLGGGPVPGLSPWAVLALLALLSGAGIAVVSSTRKAQRA